MKRMKALKKIKAGQAIIVNVDARPLKWYERLLDDARRKRSLAK